MAVTINLTKTFDFYYLLKENNEFIYLDLYQTLRHTHNV